MIYNVFVFSSLTNDDIKRLIPKLGWAICAQIVTLDSRVLEECILTVTLN